MNLQKIIEKQEELIKFLDDCNFETMVSKEAWNKRKELFNDLSSLKAEEESKTAKQFYEEQRLLGNTDKITCNPYPDYSLDFYKEIFNLMESYAQSHQVEMPGDAKEDKLKSIIHEVIWQYCYGKGDTDALFNYRDIENATMEIVELYFQPE